MTKNTARLVIFLFFVFPHPCLLYALDVGDAAKDFALPDAAGTIVTLNEATKGSPATILEFLSAYCEACQKKAPYLNQLSAKYGPQGLRILAVALANDQQETAGIIKDWGATYKIIPDPEKKTFYLYGIHKVPQIFIVDGSGIIRYKGNADEPKDIEKTVEGLLTQKGASGGAMVKPGDKAPVISLENLKGESAPVQFSDAAENTILAFFSTSDTTNREFEHMLCKLAGQGSSGVRIYAILPGALQKSAAVLDSDCAAVPLLLDRQGEAFEKYGVSRTPEIIVLSRAGYVRTRNAPQTLQELSALLKPAIAAAQTIDDKQLTQFLHKSMPGAESIRSVRIGDGETVYIADTSQGKRLARVVKKDILCEVCTDVFFIATIDEKGILKNITLIKPFELSGKTIDASSFTRQFIGKSFQQPFVAGQNADAITGATKSCAKFIEGLNDTEKVLSSLRKPPFKAAFIETVCFLYQSEIETALQHYQQKHQGKSTTETRDLAPLCPGGKLPQCPDGGVYRITVFNGIARVLCSVHGLDPRSSMIH